MKFFDFSSLVSFFDHELFVFLCESFDDAVEASEFGDESGSWPVGFVLVVVEAGVFSGFGFVFIETNFFDFEAEVVDFSF